MDRGAWQATVYEFAELDMTERLNNTGIIVNSKGERKGSAFTGQTQDYLQCWQLCMILWCSHKKRKKIFKKSNLLPISNYYANS